MANTGRPHCRIHPRVALICPACQGAKTKGVTSLRKAKASAKNGRLGGRPKLPKHSVKCQANRLDTDAHGNDFITVGCPRCEYNKTAEVEKN